ncbi:DUF262 domain-containing protein [Aeromicrobium phragmitis]|uniref:DUF262 domain-containing protein n=1 Tax=Aeromicrobium phragmitis TaxID=2478914 RepID=UPI001FB56E84|nr:DUF262 domain-containing protein [Aeromicrobium phragmitis]
MNGSFSRDLDLLSLLDGIDAGTVALPNFQRDFDWNEPDVVSLLATVLCGWPAGSLLLMSGDPSFFKVREFDSAPPVRRAALEYVVLDGQQRLTSLFHAFRGAGDKMYAIKAELAADGLRTAEAVEDALVVLKESELARPDTQAALREGRLVPLSVARTPADFYEWRDELVEALPAGERPEVSRRLATLYKNILSHAHRYKFPSMLLGRGLQPEAVARIFERINKTGMRLSTFDLLVARSYTEDWNLREVWEAAREERPNLDKFIGEDGLAVAQIIALRSAFQDVRQPAVLRLSPDDVQREWDRHVDAMDAAAAFLASLGCADISWLPYKAQLLPLAALAVDHDLEESRELLIAWLWGSSFSSSYDTASSTVAVDDYVWLRAAIAEGLGQIPRYEISRQRLRTATRSNSGALWRAVRLLIMSRQPWDLVTGAELFNEASDNLSMVSVLPRTALSADAPAPHLLAMGQVLSEKAGVRGLRSRPLGLRSEKEVDVRALERQLLPTDELGNHLFDWPLLIRERVARVESLLTEICGPTVTFRD